MYWDGTSWSRPQNLPPSPPLPRQQEPLDHSGLSKKASAAIGVCILAAVGLFITMQSVSVYGTGSLWFGVGMVAAGAAASFFLGAPTWVRVIAIMCLVFSLFNGVYLEKKVFDMRDAIDQSEALYN